MFLTVMSIVLLCRCLMRVLEAEGACENLERIVALPAEILIRDRSSAHNT